MCLSVEARDVNHFYYLKNSDSDDVFASANSHNMLIGDIDEDSDDDGYADEETTCPGNTTNNPVESFDSRLKDEQILSLF